MLSAKVKRSKTIFDGPNLEKAFDVSRAPVILFFPPGWPLTVGGPHLALALLKGFLEQRGCRADIVDLNIESAEDKRVDINAAAVQSACDNLSLNSLNIPYFAAEDRLSRIAEQFSGEWDLQSGFRFMSLDPTSSDSIRRHIGIKSPFTDFLHRRAVSLVLDGEYSLVGISIALTSQILPAFELCHLLRKAGFKGRIVLGGNIVTRLADKIRLDWVFDLVDGVICFQGEEALLALAEITADFSDVPNLIWRKDGRIVTNPAHTLQRQNFSMPDFDGLPLEKYWGFQYLPIVASRGCYYGKCTFCAIPFSWGNGGFIGHSSPEDVVATMKRSYERYGISNFKFVDEALHPQLLRQIAQFLVGESIPVAFEGYARFDAAWGDPEFLALLQKAGLRKVYLGLELAGTNSRSLLNKRDLVGKNATRILNALNQAGILTHAFCLFGFPGTGVDDAMQTVEFVYRHKHLIDSLDVFPFYYAKHTKVEGVRAILHPNKDWTVEYDYEPLRNDVLSQKEVAALCKQVEDFLWSDSPSWLHPVYRMFSPWGISSPNICKRKPHSPELVCQ